MDPVVTEQLRAHVEYLRDLGIRDFYRLGDPLSPAAQAALLGTPLRAQPAAPEPPQPRAPQPRPPSLGNDLFGAKPAPEREPARTPPPAAAQAPPPPPAFLEPPTPKPISFDLLAPLPAARVAPAGKAAALAALHAEIGDCTRCPLAYAGRRSIVFGDGDPNARLMFIGEGPGADEDTQGIPFVGKAGQLLNNMITAMGLRRDQVYIANIVKCRPPANRTPEPVEANTCSPFLLRQIDIIQPQVIVALGGTAATYVLGVRQSLASLRGSWYTTRGAKVAVTYHPAFLLRDPRQKGEAWKDLQRVMLELGLKPPTKST
jgi:uracil-DNA glycosylase